MPFGFGEGAATVIFVINISIFEDGSTVRAKAAYKQNHDIYEH